MRVASLVLYLTMMSAAANAAAMTPRLPTDHTNAAPSIIAAAAGSGGAAVSGRPGANGTVAGKPQPNGSVNGTRGK